LGTEGASRADQLEWNRSFYFGKRSNRLCGECQRREDAVIDQSNDLTITYLEGYDLIKVGHAEEVLSIEKRTSISRAVRLVSAIANESSRPDYTAVSENIRVMQMPRLPDQQNQKTVEEEFGASDYAGSHSFGRSAIFLNGRFILALQIPNRGVICRQLNVPVWEILRRWKDIKLSHELAILT